MARGRKIYEPPRYMTVNQCVAQLLEVEEARALGVCGPESLAVGIARVGSPDQCIVAGPLRELLHIDFGGPLHSLILAGETDVIEQEMMRLYAVTDATPRLAPAAGEANGERDD